MIPNDRSDFGAVEYLLGLARAEARGAHESPVIRAPYPNPLARRSFGDSGLDENSGDGVERTIFPAV